MRPGTMRDPIVVQGTLDRDGRLLAADPALLTLNAAAGGEIGMPLAIAPIAAVAWLAQRLGVPVTRQVTVADPDADLVLSVRAEPTVDQLRLVTTGWQERPGAILASAEAVPVAGADDLAWETDGGLHLTFVGHDGAARYGVDPQALLGQPLTAMFALDADRDGAMPILDAVARRRWDGVQPARLRQGDVAMLLSATIRRDAAGGMAGLIGVARPVIAAPTAARPSLTPGFTRGLDRALRSPLAKIIAHADTIHAQAEGPIQADYADYASDIANAGRHLLGLVDDLVDLAAVERPDFALTAEPIDMADVARRAAGLLSVKAANADVAIARPLAEASVPALGDFRRALQILVNLIGNAVRYSPPGGVVTVTAARVGTMAEAVVADQGKGIARDDQARIFEKFERVDPSEPGGNGLGLYIARRLARAMGGDLTVASAPGEGATFTLTLPA
ncbi:sensor histidine kinase [Sphingomonas sp. XXL09]|uniref:sensor histidine kinase n=1 Tax=Sphingomonas sp. XXL09 TaxID=3457787 RepID=UPI00406BB373